jgi:hypothetical protein
MPILPQGQTSGGALGDLLGNVDRPQLNAFVANAQARNGLVSAQTQEAMIKASQAQEQMQAWDDLQTNLIKKGYKASDAAIVRAAQVGANNHDPETAMKVDAQANLMVGSPDEQVRGSQAFNGKLETPPAASGNFFPVPGQSGAFAGATPLQSPQGQAQTDLTQQQTKTSRALSGLDVANAEKAHAAAKAQSSPTGGLTPAGLSTAIDVVMADPTKMSSYAGYGGAGQKNKDTINNGIAERLNAANMTTDDLITHRAVGKASIGSAGAAAKQIQVLDAFTPLVRNNANRITQLLDQIDASGSAGIDEPIVNGFERLLGRKLGSDDLNELNSVFTTYQFEISRMLASGPSMNGVISDHARKDVEAMAPSTMTASNARRVLNRIDVELSVRHKGTEDSLNEAARAQLPVTSHQPGNAPGGVAGAADNSDLPPGMHRVN